MTTWITSDLHFGHKNILNFSRKHRSQYANVEEMNAGLAAEWNYLVKSEDTVYVLGDVSFKDGGDSIPLIKSLKGKKILIAGNHDKKMLQREDFVSCFESVHNYLEIVHNDMQVILFHYPIAEWNGVYYGSIHFYGHLHGKPSGLEEYRARDVGFDAAGRVVWNLDDAVADAKTGKKKTN